MDFPAYMYNEELGAKLFKNEKELSDAGKGWLDSPAKFGCVEEKEITAEELRERLVKEFKFTKAKVKKLKKADLEKLLDLEKKEE